MNLAYLLVEEIVFGMAKLRRTCYARAMSVQSCRVSIRDTEGIEHSAEVTAESLYEAVALGLRAIRQCSWVDDIDPELHDPGLGERYAGRAHGRIPCVS
jgi:hypothetical protein